MGLIPDSLIWRWRRRYRHLHAQPGLRIAADTYGVEPLDFAGPALVRAGALLNRARIGRHCDLAGRISQARLGDGCTVLSEAIVGGLGRHPVDQVSIHAAFYASGANAHPGLRLVDQQAFHGEVLETRLGHRVWVGVRAIILNGVSVGDGCIIDHHCVVTRDLPANTIVSGVPGRVVGPCLAEDVFAASQAAAWWTWPAAAVEAALQVLRNPHLSLSDWQRVEAAWAP